MTKVVDSIKQKTLPRKLRFADLKCGDLFMFENTDKYSSDINQKMGRSYRIFMNSNSQLSASDTYQFLTTEEMDDVIVSKMKEIAIQFGEWQSFFEDK